MFSFSITHLLQILGLVNGRGWLSILFPSRHKPLGDGLSWDSIYSSNIKFTYGSFRN